MTTKMVNPSSAPETLDGPISAGNRTDCAVKCGHLKIVLGKIVGQTDELQVLGWNFERYTMVKRLRTDPQRLRSGAPYGVGVVDCMARSGYQVQRGAQW